MLAGLPSYWNFPPSLKIDDLSSTILGRSQIQEAGAWKDTCCTVCPYSCYAKYLLLVLFLFSAFSPTASGDVCREDPDSGPQVAGLSQVPALSSAMIFELLQVNNCPSDLLNEVVDHLGHSHVAPQNRSCHMKVCNVATLRRLSISREFELALQTHDTLQAAQRPSLLSCNIEAYFCSLHLTVQCEKCFH